MRNDVWSVYILLLADNTYYTGITNDIPRRLKLHEIGKGSKYVRARLPLVLKYVEEVGSLSEAARRERAIKKLKHAQKKKLIEKLRKKEKDMTFPIEPILDRIIIKKDEMKEESGFHVPDTVKGRSKTGTVVAAGPGRINVETGKYIPLAVKAGDKVLLKEFDGHRLDWEGETYYIFTENEIIGKLCE